MRRTLVAQQMALVNAIETGSKTSTVALLHGELLPKLQITKGLQNEEITARV